jgi:DNA-directed RNA polymerase specialized sigma24 family protein
MDPEVLVDELMRLAPQVHGAAVAASRDAGSAARVTERVLCDATRRRDEGQPVDLRHLVERAIRLGVSSCPALRFAAIDERDREAIALARLGGYSVAEVARALETDAADVKRRMSRGLTVLAAEISAKPTQPPLAELA